MIGYSNKFANRQQSKALNSKRAAGFTLVELVIVIIILGILSVTVAPKFFSSKGFSEYAYRADVIAKLRLIQTRAMQQVNVLCHRVNITEDKLGKVTCGTLSEFSDQSIQRATVVAIESGDNVTFSPVGLTFTFDHLGRPQDCNNPCDITITGEQSLVVRIENEGYIHAL